VRCSPDAIFVLDTEGRVKYINPAGEAILGETLEDYQGRSMLDYVHPEDAALALSSLETVQNKPVGTPVEVRIAVKPGRWLWTEVIGRNCAGVPGVDGIVFGARDLTQRRMWEISANDLGRFQQIVHNAAALVMALDAEGVITEVNGALTRLIGLDPSLAIHRQLASLTAPGHNQEVTEAIARASANGSAAIEVPMRHARTGGTVPIRFEIVDLLDDPVVGAFVVTGQDVSDLDAVRRRLEHLATHDALTGLCNRSLLEERLNTLIEARRPLALLYVDLDQFKPVNDKHGHDVGDEVLRLVARRLAAGVSGGDLVARVGGDEFVIIALGIASRVAAIDTADRLAATLAQPYQVGTTTVTIGASVGAVVSDPTATAAELLAAADLAMYANKTPRPGGGPAA
jgi:diguanylate cyclase (GGDEF)-like protein/PAS domain S-box-containing protein